MNERATTYSILLENYRKWAGHFRKLAEIKLKILAYFVNLGATENRGKKPFVPATGGAIQSLIGIPVRGFLPLHQLRST